MNDLYRLPLDEQAAAMRGLAVQALKKWNVENAELNLIKMRENAVFRVDTADGERFVVRIHRLGYHSDTALHSELQWMAALQAAGIDVPRVIPSAAGRLFENLSGGEVTDPHQVDLWEWIEGTPLGASGEALAADRERLRHVFYCMGELCAQVHNQSERWQYPDGFMRHAWDEEGLTGPEPFWGRFWELHALSEAQRDLILRARARVHEELKAFGKSRDRYGLIHADLTPENVLEHGKRLRLIDFDDAGYGWFLFDIATALFFHIPEEYFEDAQNSMIAGYRAHRELSDEMLAHLPLFFTARAFTYLGWVQTREQTETARELTPMLVELVCSVAGDYLKT